MFQIWMVSINWMKLLKKAATLLFSTTIDSHAIVHNSQSNIQFSFVRSILFAPPNY